MQRLEHLRLSQPRSPIIPLAVSTHHPSHRQPLLAKIMSSQSTVTTAAATHEYPSPLNTPFLLTTGDYNQVAAGTPWFKSSLFPLLPFLQISRKLPPYKSRTASTAYYLRQMQHQASKTLAYDLLPKRRLRTIPYVIPYSHLQYTHDHTAGPSSSPQYWITCNNTALPGLPYTGSGPTHMPPWPPPYQTAQQRCYERHQQVFHCNHHHSSQHPNIYPACVASLFTPSTSDKNLLRPP